ncbi:endonuclease/exonuclease/phosphatase domain-containing protein [Toxoplasma gondii CAST]|uniref:Endonuclease/exonuclease/phosphatase domain-containing protein n=1 Tax=Toxoplasma gondii CAST TaxID=943122 RepID=A0A425HWS7_TOXGO|nr:endonuclease/exonuclease/phosphatase domain-containing protein [Toxoplasma gondii CAST]
MTRQTVMVGVYLGNETSRVQMWLRIFGDTIACGFFSFPIYSSFQGDSISMLYTGTGSVFTSHMKQGGKATFSSNLDHAWKALGRFYQNTFEDTYRQEVIDVFLGLHRLSTSVSSSASNGQAVRTQSVAWTGSPSKSGSRPLLAGYRTLSHAVKAPASSCGDPGKRLHMKAESMCELAPPKHPQRLAETEKTGHKPRLGVAAPGGLHSSAPSSSCVPASLSSFLSCSSSLGSSSSFPGNSGSKEGGGDAEREVQRDGERVSDSLEARPEGRVASEERQVLRLAERKREGQRGDRRRGEGDRRAERVGGGDVPLRLWVGTWNLAGKDLHEWDDIEPWLTPVKEQADVYVFCIQELVELTGFRVLMNMKDSDKEARLEQKASAGVNNLVHHFPEPPSSSLRRRRLQAFCSSLSSSPQDPDLSHSPSVPSPSPSVATGSAVLTDAFASHPSSLASALPRGSKKKEEGGSVSFFGRQWSSSSFSSVRSGNSQEAVPAWFSWASRPADDERGPEAPEATRGDTTGGARETAAGAPHSTCAAESSRGRRKPLPPFVKVRACSMVGLLIIVYIRTELRHLLAGVEVSSVKVGLKGNAGNKGAVCVRLCIGATSFCFVNVHLASGPSSGQERMQQMTQILQQAFQSGPAYTPPILEHDFVLVGGDFNFRLVASHQQVADTLGFPNPVPVLLKSDQFYVSKRHAVPPFFQFREAPISFLPTYKYKKSSSHYDMKRTPAWCDRILFCGKLLSGGTQSCSSLELNRTTSGLRATSETGDSNRATKRDEATETSPLQVLSYTDHPRYFASDHKPVSLVLNATISIPNLPPVSGRGSSDSGESVGFESCASSPALRERGGVPKGDKRDTDDLEDFFLAIREESPGPARPEDPTVYLEDFETAGDRELEKSDALLTEDEDEKKRESDGANGARKEFFGETGVDRTDDEDLLQYDRGRSARTAKEEREWNDFAPPSRPAARGRDTPSVDLLGDSGPEVSPPLSAAVELAETKQSLSPGRDFDLLEMSPGFKTVKPPFGEQGRAAGQPPLAGVAALGPPLGSKGDSRGPQAGRADPGRGSGLLAVDLGDAGTGAGEAARRGGRREDRSRDAQGRGGLPVVGEERSDQPGGQKNNSLWTFLEFDELKDPRESQTKTGCVAPGRGQEKKPQDPFDDLLS